MTTPTLPVDPAVLPAPRTDRRLLVNWKLAVLTAYALWVLLIGASHEPWFDEAQAWLLVRDNDFWPLLIERVRYEGTPGLWHAILWVAVHAGLPYSQYYLLSASFAIAGAGVVLWRAPFPPALRVAILASYFFGFQFSVVARSYCLDLLLVPLVASFFATRVERPLRYALVVGLIANANAHGFLGASVLGLEFAWRLWQSGRWRDAAGGTGLLLAGGLGLIAVAVAKQPADNAFLHPEWREGVGITFMYYFGNAFLDRLTVWSSEPVDIVNSLAGLGISLVLQRPVISLILKGQNRLLALGLFGLIIGFSVLIYASPWHAGLLFLFWIFILWVHWDLPISQKLRRQVVIAVSILLALQVCETITAGLWDRNNVYSPGEAVAQDVANYRKTHPDARIAGLGYKAFDIQPWLPGNIFVNYHGGAPRPSYILWDSSERWTARVTPQTWREMVALRPELIVASPLDPRRGRMPLEDWACRTGYGLKKKHRGMMIWRGARHENETLLLFERGSRSGCGA